jgi:hypothetical protein
MFVYSDWKQDDRVELGAFDVTGAAGRVWECGDTRGESDLYPARVDMGGADHGWISLRARDGSGNMSHPVWIPR